jgi:hypothetical protein
MSTQPTYEARAEKTADVVANEMRHLLHRYESGSPKERADARTALGIWVHANANVILAHLERVQPTGATTMTVSSHQWNQRQRLGTYQPRQFVKQLRQRAEIVRDQLLSAANAIEGLCEKVEAMDNAASMAGVTTANEKQEQRP